MTIKKRPYTHTGMIALAACGMCAIPSSATAQGFLGNLFNKDKKGDDEAVVSSLYGTENSTKPSNPRTVLTEGQLSEQESAASGILAAAQAEETAGRYGKAYDAYKKIVKTYPRTQAAAESQYKMGEMREAEGNDKKAFENYQALIRVYKNSARFTDALNRQFGIADRLKNSEKKGFGGIGAAVQPSKLVEMFQQIANNAPYTEFAPRSLLSIGYIHTEEADFPAAITAFQEVADNYQNTAFASEAQFQVFKLRGKLAEKSFSPVADRAQEEAGMDFVGTNPNDARTIDVKAQLGEIEDRKMEKLFNIGRFYEGQKQPKSAAVYYREIIKFPGGKRFNDAQGRLAAIQAENPEVAVTERRSQPQTSSARVETFALPGEEVEPEAASQGPLKKMLSGIGGKKDDIDEEAALLGPAPAENAGKPTMRTSNTGLIPIPTDDPVAGN